MGIRPEDAYVHHATALAVEPPKSEEAQAVEIQNLERLGLIRKIDGEAQ